MAHDQGSRDEAVGRGWLRWLRLARRVRAERRALAALEPRLRQDIGLAEEEIAQEAARAPWDLPEERAATAPPFRAAAPSRRDKGGGSWERRVLEIEPGATLGRTLR